MANAIITSVYGNLLRLRIPLTLRVINNEGETPVATDADFIPNAGYPVMVIFADGAKSHRYNAVMDGNVAVVEVKGDLPIGSWALAILCRDADGNPMRFAQRDVVRVVNYSADAGLDPGIEFQGEVHVLDAAVKVIEGIWDYYTRDEIDKMGFLTESQLNQLCYSKDAVDVKLADKAMVNGSQIENFATCQLELSDESGEDGRLIFAKAYIDHNEEAVTMSFTDNYNYGARLEYTFDNSTGSVKHIASEEYVADYVAEHGGGGSVDQVQADWNQTTTTAPDYIKNKPTIPAAQIQADWNQTNTSAKDFIKNKPTIPSNVSDLTNDSGFTSNAGTITGITMNGASKGTSGVVDLGTVITAHQDISGKANASDVYTKTQTDTLLSGKLSKSDVSVETQGDGTVDINVDNDTYTINLNHTHENMAKLVVCEESDLPSTLDNDTIYCQVDDAEDPTEIQSLWIAGLEFVGGGGSADDGMPKMVKPKDESTINLGTNEGSGVSKSIVVQAKNLDYGGSTTGLTIEAVSTGLSISYGQQTGQSSITIPQSNGVVNTEITVAYSGSGALADGELRFKQGNSVLAVVVVVVVVQELPEDCVDNSAWNASSGEEFSAPDPQQGYLTTKFYPIAHNANHQYSVTIKAGFVTPTDLSRGMFVSKKATSDAKTNAAFLQSTDPRRKDGTDLTYDHLYNYISATLKKSELANCYIYDNIAGTYLFAGANVDTSTPPNVNPT